VIGIDRREGTVMSIARSISASMFIVAGAGLLAIAAAGSATARPEAAPEPASVQSARVGDCALTRIDDQFARCDDLTGAGVPAPGWIPEQ
jgi:hypothetical protein